VQHYVFRGKNATVNYAVLPGAVVSADVSSSPLTFADACNQWNVILIIRGKGARKCAKISEKCVPSQPVHQVIRIMVATSEHNMCQLIPIVRVSGSR
jgi:hypothetical protein